MFEKLNFGPFRKTKTSVRQQNSILLHCCHEENLRLCAYIKHYLITTEECGLTGDNQVALNVSPGLLLFLLYLISYIKIHLDLYLSMP